VLLFAERQYYINIQIKFINRLDLLPDELIPVLTRLLHDLIEGLIDMYSSKDIPQGTTFASWNVIFPRQPASASGSSLGYDIQLLSAKFESIQLSQCRWILH